MKFSVLLTAEASQDVIGAFEYIAEHGPADPESWKAGLLNKFASLEVFPERCGIAPESKHRSFPIYQTFYGSFRILFIVDEQTVSVLTVRHGARLPMSSKEIDERT